MEAVLIDLRAERVRRGLSQLDVAQRAGTTQSAIARLESGAGDPRFSTVQRYAAALGAAVEARVELPSLVGTAEAVRESLSRTEVSEALRQVVQFLNDIASLEAAIQSAAVRHEPESVGDVRWDALLAAVAEYVSSRTESPVPGWASAPGRFLHRFWFVVEDILGRAVPGLAVAAFASTPPAFANRGVFLDRSSLVSV